MTDYSLNFEREGESIWGSNGPSRLQESFNLVDTLDLGFKIKESIPGIKAEIAVDAGFTFGLRGAVTLDPGTFDSQTPVDVSLDIPDDIVFGQEFSLGGSYVLTGGKLESTSPTVKASIGLVAGLELGGSAEIFLKAFGKQTKVLDKSFSLIDSRDYLELASMDGLSISFLPQVINALSSSLGSEVGSVLESLNTIDFDTVQFDLVQYGVPSAGFGVTYTIGNLYPTNIGEHPEGFPRFSLGDVTFGIPVVEASGGLRDGTRYVADGEDDLLDLDLDIDGLLQRPGEIEFNLSKKATLKVELFDIDFGPDFDVYQNVTYKPDLSVRLDFDREIDIDGTLANSVTVNVDELDSLSFKLDDYVAVTPTFLLGGSLTVDTGIDFDVDLTIAGGRFLLDYKLSSGKTKTIGAGPLFDEDITIFSDRLSIYDKTFDASVQEIVGDPFVIGPVLAARDDTAGTDEIDAIVIDLLGNDAQRNSGGTLAIQALDLSGVAGLVTDNGD
ncbi:hypothetical protein GCM10011371_32410 [Novosphingobium marinum]|uniref:Uncharacterized protein n=1 Tax=Novosphingobium marinum TaxID=1514948 RepID=A0A7Y9XYD8_9SPHN|nr:hypothetical protein [Novosphingobium marinum]NYH96899.1 hypothetical protein [Novosphingobium marinum]GGC42546.1 hypothetical protein GCM10011371_32410 [Novosphingobium marinum]